MRLFQWFSDTVKLVQIQSNKKLAKIVIFPFLKNFTDNKFCSVWFDHKNCWDDADRFAECLVNWVSLQKKSRLPLLWRVLKHILCIICNFFIMSSSRYAWTLELFSEHAKEIVLPFNGTRTVLKSKTNRNKKCQLYVLEFIFECVAPL